MAEFLMPALGADMESGTLVQWHVKPGDCVKSGDVVAVVETHKGAIDCEIFLDGVVEDLVPVGTELPIGAVLAHIRVENEPAGRARVPAAPPPAPVPPPTTVAPLPVGTRAHPTKATPAARKRAAELHVDLAALQGTGVDGSICLRDVEGAQRKAGFDPAAMRQAIATAMGRSKREIPHYYLASTIDFEAAATWLAAYNAERPPQARLLPAVLLLKASALALQACPQLNGFHENGAFRPGTGIHVGWAVSLRGGGLIAPAIHHADQRTLPELMEAMRDVVQRARAGGLRSSELTDPTVTVTNLGERGADSVLGVIYPPQVALIGFGRVAPRPWVHEGQLAVRQLVQASLAADHRASDGHLGGQLLAAIDAALQRPDTL